MDQAARLDSIVAQYEQLSWSPALTDAITTYLSGAGTLAQVDLAWKNFNDRAPLVYLWRLRVLSDAEDRPLDTLDLRLMDLFELFGELSMLLYPIPWRDVAQQIADHLRSHGRDEQTIRRVFFSVVQFVAFDPIRSPETLTPMGRSVFAYLPQYAEEMFNAQNQHFSHFFRMLLLVQPPEPELVWQMAQRLEQRTVDTYNLGYCVSLLLQADPACYTPWARRLAGLSSPLTNQTSRLAALEALMRHDPAQHIDLALEMAQSPITDRYASMQCGALRQAYEAAPTRALPLLEEAAAGKHYWLGYTALKLLAKAPFAQVCPALQRCVVEGHAILAFRALERLLRQPWAGQQEFLLTLVNHRSKKIRERATAALKSQGVAIP